MPLKVAILNNLETIPWMPLVAGMAEGFEALGAEVKLIRISDVPDVHLTELDRFRPNLALLPFCRREFDRRTPYMELLGLPSRECTVAAVLWDDPYDMETGLWLEEEVDAIFTPEQLAIEFYKVPAFHVRPTISEWMHYPPHVPIDKIVDVAMVGGVHWRPRAQILPVIRNLCIKHQRNYTEVAGNNRWLCGEGLTNFLHRSRVLLEIPRFDLPTRTNPHQVPCTYTGPRSYIAARCGAFVMAIGPRPDFGELFPHYKGYEDIEAALDDLAPFLAAPYSLDRAGFAQQRHTATNAMPVEECAHMLKCLVEADVFDAVGRVLSKDLLLRIGLLGERGSKSPPTEENEAAPASQP